MKEAKRVMLHELDKLQLFPFDLLRLIIDYWLESQYSTLPYHTWLLSNGKPCGLAAQGGRLLVCDYNHSLLAYALEGQGKKKKCLWLETPWAIDTDANGMYVINKTHVYSFNRKREVTFSWRLPVISNDELTPARGIKIDGEFCYVTISNFHSIFVCEKKGGKLIKKYGSDTWGQGPGEFNDPRGITVDPEKGLYICDRNNHRIQVLDKDIGTFLRTWGSEGTKKGQFEDPISIHYAAHVLYVGDFVSVQLFTREGLFLQRLGDKKQVQGVYGLWVRQGQLYVSDTFNQRIHVFGKMKQEDNFVTVTSEIS